MSLEILSKQYLDPLIAFRSAVDITLLVYSYVGYRVFEQIMLLKMIKFAVFKNGVWNCWPLRDFDKPCVLNETMNCGVAFNALYF